MSLSNKRPKDLVFSGGTGRSGTTIIGKLLGRHPIVRASKPLEIKFLSANAGLLDLTFGRRDFIEMKKRKSFVYRLLSLSSRFATAEMERKFEERLFDDWWERGSISGKGSGLSSSLSTEVRDEAYSVFIKARRKDPKSAAIEFFYTLIESQSNNNGEPIWIDTSPPNIFNADRIHILFPNAKYVHMKRDGRNTIASVLKEHWGPRDPLAAIHWWKNRIIASKKALTKVPQSQVIEIQLEEFAYYDREAQYERLLGFLNLVDSPSIRNYFETEVDGKRVIASRWQEEISEPKFLKKFNSVHRELCELGIDTALYG